MRRIPFAARVAALVVIAAALVGGYLRIVDDDGSEPSASPVADVTTTVPSGAVDQAHDHHCRSRGVEVDGEWRCDVANAELVSAYPFDARPTTAQRKAAANFAVETEAAMQRYRDYDVAKAAGYTFDERAAWLIEATGTPWEQEAHDQFAAGTVTHLVNPAAANDAAVADPTAPEALMYATDGERHVLVGALFLAPVGQHGPQVGGPITTWHQHTEGDVVCWDGAAAVGFAHHLPGDERYEPTGGCAQGAPLERSPEMLHVWFGRSDITEVFSSEMTSAEAAAIVEAG